jgi:molybdopterin/thiamine biosynthesis adenylyltransferase/rhodanese-related sulfurtransferase
MVPVGFPIRDFSRFIFDLVHDLVHNWTMTTHGFTTEEIARYSRQMLLPEVGVEGQARLKGASILVVGAGGLGSPAALYLAAAGIGHLGLVDFDRVEISNLHRQVLYADHDIGQSKLDTAKKQLQAHNPHIEIELHKERLGVSNVRGIFSLYDMVLDGTDTFSTRYLVNDACVLMAIPNIHGSVYRFEGQVSVFSLTGAEQATARDSGSPCPVLDGPCYRCLYPKPPGPGSVPNCAEGGVLGILPGIIGLIQATEAIKLVLRKGDYLAGRLLVFDALRMQFRELKIKRDPGCPVCGDTPTITELTEMIEPCTTPGQECEMNQPPVRELEVAEVKDKLDGDNPPILLDVREDEELAICKLEPIQHIPMGELEERFSELPEDREIIIYCRMGGRSAMAAQFLQSQGFDRVYNMAGGILAWSAEIDSSMPQY